MLMNVKHVDILIDENIESIIENEDFREFAELDYKEKFEINDGFKEETAM